MEGTPMAGLSLRTFLKLVALLLPAALLSVFLGTPTVRANTSENPAGASAHLVR